MWIILKKFKIKKRVVDLIAPPLDAEDQRNLYQTEDGETYYSEEIEDVYYDNFTTIVP